MRKKLWRLRVRFKMPHALLMLATLTTGCAAKHFGPLPQSDTDFRKPPAELRATFAGLTEFPGENQPGQMPPPLAELEAQWGAAPQKKLDQPAYLAPRTAIGTVFLGTVGPTGAGVALFALPFAIPPTEYVRTYEKGDYVIAVHTHDGMGAERVVQWDWTYRTATDNTTLFTDANEGARRRSINHLGGVFGSGWMQHKFDPNHPKINGGFSFLFGQEFPVPSDPFDVAVMIGYHSVGAADPNTKDALHISDIPLQATFEAHATPDIKLGIGAAKHFNAKLWRNYSNNASLGAPVGSLLTGEYIVTRRLGIVVTAEHLNYKISGEPRIGGDSLTLAFNMRY